MVAAWGPWLLLRSAADSRVLGEPARCLGLRCRVERSCLAWGVGMVRAVSERGCVVLPPLPPPDMEVVVGRVGRAWCSCGHKAAGKGAPNSRLCLQKFGS